MFLLDGVYAVYFLIPISVLLLVVACKLSKGLSAFPPGSLSGLPGGLTGWEAGGNMHS
jgi:hypothetical protein